MATKPFLPYFPVTPRFGHYLAVPPYRADNDMYENGIREAQVPRFQRSFALLLYVSLSASNRFACAQDQQQIASLVLRFQQTHGLADKERILNLIIQEGYAAGPPLLRLAKATNDNDTRWLAIRGLGMLKFEDASPFLIESLKSDEHYVRANAARALGELRYSPAGPALIHLLADEQDAGVIEQASLALRMIKAQNAIPTIESRMSFNSAQTRCWLLDAIAGLGSKSDVPFIAKYLYISDTASEGVPLCASRALATLTGEDFGLPKTGGLFDPQAPVSKARKWWEQTQYRPQ
ncbi:MAG TPA: HEAT repeat domain-containing protein [Bryobacteraceae bacterium]